MSKVKKKSIEVTVLHQSIPGGGPCLSLNGNRVCWPKPKEQATVKYAFSLKIDDLLAAIPGLSYNPPSDNEDESL